MKYILKAPIIFYLGIIFVFSVIYFSSSSVFPDNFIVNRKLNEHPFSEIKKLIWDSDKKSEEVVIQDVKNILSGVDEAKDDFAQIKKVIIDYEKLSIKIQNLKSERIAFEASFDELHKKLNQDIDKKIDVYKDKFRKEHIEPINSKIFLLKKEIIKITNLFKKKSSIGEHAEALSLLDQLSQKNDEYFETIHLLNDKGSELTNYVLDHRWAFADRSDAKQWDEMKEKELSYYGKFRDLEDEMRKTYLKLEEFVYGHGENQAKTLSFLDCLYFSIGVSTTTTFGDIIPNSPFTRSTVIFQLFLCLGVVGALVHKMKEFYIS